MPNSGKKKQGASSAKKSTKSPGVPEFRRSKIDDEMSMAAFKGDIDEVKKCLAEGADVNCLNNLGENMDFFIQTITILNQNLSEFSGGNLLMTVIIYADPLTNDHLEVFKILLENGININHRMWMEAPFSKCFSVLHVAFMKESIIAINFLLENGAEVDYSAKDFLPVLHMAASGGKTEIAKALLSHESVRKNIDIKSKDFNQALGRPYNDTPLMQAVSSGHVEVAMLLIEHGADVQGMADDSDMSILHQAAGLGNIPLLKKILEKGANVDQKGFAGFNPLKTAILERHVEVVKVLLEHGSDPNYVSEGNNTVLHTACSEKDMAENVDNAALKIFKLLIEFGAGASVNTRDRHKWIPLHYAAKYGKVEELEEMIKLGADINASNEYG